MLKKEDIEKVAGFLKVSPEELEKAITDKDVVAFTIPEGLQVFTADELNTFQKNKYDSGKKDGLEKAVKDAANVAGIEFKGTTIDGLLKAAQKKAVDDAGINPDQRVTELTKQIDVLKGSVTEYEGKLTAKDGELNGMRDNYELYRHIPGPSENGVLYTQEDIVAAMKIRGFNFTRNSQGQLVAEKGGQPQVDKLGNPLPIGEVVTGFMKESRYITDTPPTIGGRGKGDQKPTPGSKPANMSELKAKYEAAGKSMNGEEFSKEYESLVFEQNSTFDPNS